MNVLRNLVVALLMTVVTTVLLGFAYPMLVTVLAQAIFPAQANGQLIVRDGQVIGSPLIAQGFALPRYFHPRPSAAGSGYDAANSAGSQLGPTNRKLIKTIMENVASARRDNPGRPVPIDLVTASASGLDPHISPAAAEFQVPRVARARGISEHDLRRLVLEYTERRQWGFLGEPRVNVLELNLALDKLGKSGSG